MKLWIRFTLQHHLSLEEASTADVAVDVQQVFCWIYSNTLQTNTLTVSVTVQKDRFMLYLEAYMRRLHHISPGTGLLNSKDSVLGRFCMSSQISW